MNKIWKSALMIVLTLTMIFSGTVIAFGENANGINVQLNGQNVAFTDAAPKNVNGNTMVPLRQMLETLGATVTYDAKTKTVTANAAGKVISFAVGTTDVTIDENGTKTIKKMNIAPFIDSATQKTYVSVRFFAENLGYMVDWDAVEKTVVIIDPASLFANADEDFSIIGKLLKTELDLEKPYAVNGKFDANVITYPGPESALSGLNVSVTGNYTGIQQKSNAEMAMKLSVNFDKMMNSLSPEDRDMMSPLLDLYRNISMNLKMDGETGVVYMNSNMFSAIDPAMGENTWYKMNAYKPYEEMGINMGALSGIGYSDVGIGELLEAGFSQSDLDVNTYQDVKVTYTLLKNLIGNGAFQTKISGDTATHTLKITPASMIPAIIRTALSEGVSGDLDMNELKELTDINAEATIIIKEKSGALDSYDLKGSGSMEGSSISFSFSGDQRNSTGEMSLNIDELIKMTINMDSSLKETSETPDVNPPAGAKIVDYPVY